MGLPQTGATLGRSARGRGHPFGCQGMPTRWVRQRLGPMSAKLVLHPPDQQGWRRVRYDGVAIGVAHRPADIRAFLAQRRVRRHSPGQPRATAGPLPHGGRPVQRSHRHRPGSVAPGPGLPRVPAARRTRRGLAPRLWWRAPTPSASSTPGSGRRARPSRRIRADLRPAAPRPDAAAPGRRPRRAAADRCPPPRARGARRGGPPPGRHRRPAPPARTRRGR